MQQAYNKRLVDYPRESAPSAKDVKSLGLIKDQKPEDVHLKASKYIPHQKPRIT